MLLFFPFLQNVILKFVRVCVCVCMCEKKNELLKQYTDILITVIIWNSDLDMQYKRNCIIPCWLVLSYMG